MTTYSTLTHRCRAHARRLARLALDVVCPPRCPGCQIRLAPDADRANGGWCQPCGGTVFALEGPRCPVCATPRPPQIGRVYRGIDHTCAACVERRPAFERTESLFE